MSVGDRASAFNFGDPPPPPPPTRPAVEWSGETHETQRMLVRTVDDHPGNVYNADSGTAAQVQAGWNGGTHHQWHTCLISPARTMQQSKRITTATRNA